MNPKLDVFVIPKCKECGSKMGYVAIPSMNQTFVYCKNNRCRYCFVINHT